MVACPIPLLMVLFTSVSSSFTKHYNVLLFYRKFRPPNICQVQAPMYRVISYFDTVTTVNHRYRITKQCKDRKEMF